MIKKIVCVLMCACILNGCAEFIEAQKRAKAEATVQAGDTPHCKDDAECKRLMAAAYAWVSDNCSMKVQIVNDYSIETFSPILKNQLGCKVTKRPTPDGDYELVIDTACKECLFFDPVFPRAKFNQYLKSIMEGEAKE
jgi:hypothetical protein